MNNIKKFFIHGGSSLISKFLIEQFKDDFDELYVFCRNTDKTKAILNIEDYQNKKFFFFQNDLEDLEMTLHDINKLPNDLDGVFWVTGVTGNPDKEYDNKSDLE